MNPSNHHNYVQKVIAKSGYNEIVFCRQCNLYHVHFETISIDLSLRGLFSLMEDLQLKIKENLEVEFADQRCIEIAAPSKNIRIYFSLNDCKELAQMIVDSIKVIRNQPRKSRWN